jgi:hypothetical protein
VDLEKLKALLRTAHIAFAERSVPNSSPPRKALHVQRPGFSVSITPSVYHYGANIEMRPVNGPRITFNSAGNPAKLVAAMDTLVQVARLAPRLNWATRQLALITGPYPGSPVLLYEPCADRLEIIPRPPSFNQLHKHAAVRTYQLDADPKTIASQLNRLRRQNQPRRSWSSIVDDWNQKYSGKFGHELSLGASYIYAWNGFRFLLDGEDLCLDVWQPVSNSAFTEAISLLKSVQDVMKSPKAPNCSERKGEPNSQRTRRVAQEGLSEKDPIDAPGAG